MAKKKKGKGASVKADFSKVEEGGGRFRVPEGDYRFKVVAAKIDTSEKSGNTMIVWTFEGVEGKVKGKRVKDYTTITAKSLWKLRDLLTAMGVKVPKKVVSITPSKYVGKELGLTLSDDEYEGKISSKPSDYLDIETLESGGVDDEDDEDLEDEEDEDDEDDDEEEEDEDDEEDLEEMDVDDEL